VAATPKKVASRYYQLKVGHAAIGTYLRRIGAQETKACRWYTAPRECEEAHQREGIGEGKSMKTDAPGRGTGGEASGALLRFLQQTDVGWATREARRMAERTYGIRMMNGAWRTWKRGG
jgi:hypothetical protein